MKGPGVTVEMNDAQKPVGSGQDPNLFIIHDDDILAVVNELFAAGAEAMCINGQRVVATTEVRCVGPVIMVNGNRVAPVSYTHLDVYKRQLVTVAGAHGKTTTSSMIAWVMEEAGVDPTYLVGGQIGDMGNAKLGNGAYAVVETDESDGSFPVSYTHLDVYKRQSTYRKGYNSKRCVQC